MLKITLSKKDSLPPPSETLEEKVERLEREIEILKSVKTDLATLTATVSSMAKKVDLI